MIPNPKIHLPESELSWRFSRSSGPGGQHVNTTETRVEVLWSPATSKVLDEDQLTRVLSRLGHRLTNGQISVVSSRYRSQLRNRDDAIEILEQLVAEALVQKRRRRPSKPSRSAIERQKSAKRRRSELKTGRRQNW
ncbi:MAG TPA: alternative ribosome rescue aminoacyl-tRNA hydrolase ArfB [Aeromicrobium sp.]|nr:alternative ribosome rescue aminoacyl-tRNA hydrolase ArfB [Aeromicrobium sp.]